MAEIVNRRPNPDGTSDLLTIGSRRFQVREILRSGRPYLRAEVEWLAETVGAATPELVAAARALFERYAEVVRALSGESTDVTLAAEPVPAIISQKVEATAEISVPRPSVSRTIMSSRSLPYMSPRRPMIDVPTEAESRYPVSSQAAPVSVAWRSCWIVGSAGITAELSTA